MSSEKVFILGLDGASPEVIESLIDLGRLPTFEKMKKEGVMGKLRTTIPPITGSAWSSFMTGKNPGKHGIFDFITRKEGTYHLTPINSNLREGKPFWSWASDAGKKVCIFNVPITYPPEKVNGAMVSGMLTPRGRTDYTQPQSLAKELDRVTRGYRIHMDESFSKGREERFLKHLYEVTEQRIRAMEYLFKKEDWDLFIGIIEGIDLIQHELWHCWDPGHFRHPSSNGRFSDAIPSFYKQMDEFLRRILEEWIDSRWTIIIMSDHGAGPLKKLFYINNFLMRKGFLKLKGGVRSSIKHFFFQAGFVPMTFYHLLLRIGLGRMKKMARFGQGESWLKPFFLSFEDVEWSRTRAYSFGSTAGQIYLNLKDREPQGIVSPGEEAEEVRKNIIQELRSLVDEETGEEVVGEIYRKEELYHGPHLKDAPDIVFLPKTLEIAAFGEYEFASHRMIDHSWGVSGSHRMDGLLTVRGKSFQQGMSLQGSRIIDLAPSALYLLGLPIPDAMDGRVLQQAFSEGVFQERPVRFIDEEVSSDFLPEEIYSDEEEEELKRRLKTLGYFT
jgi:predicted AlkP superfamily phosphohydrolase/phosphomutase